MSGGIDSMACAHFLIGQSFKVSGLFVDYGQSACPPEQTAVSAVAKSLRIPLERASFVSKRRYGAGEIPGRNGLLTMAALAVCSPNTRIIGMGIHSGTPYYDCSPAFADRIDALVQEYTSGLTRYLAPFLSWTKQDIFEYCR
jgi:7-cyano-7-deazaguanine synthase